VGRSSSRPRTHDARSARCERGHSNQAIADELVLTKRAVEKHNNAIFLKLSLGEAADISRRVKAALIYLAEHSRASGVPAQPR
jgi:DNA-binding NarL/FixJ family response regulator